MENEINLPNEIVLLDSQLLEIKVIESDRTVDVIILLQLRYPSMAYLKITFKQVDAYSFYWNSDYAFYIISDYKLLKNNNMFYLSLDPDLADDLKLESDQDYVLSKRMTVYFSDENREDSFRVIFDE